MPAIDPILRQDPTAGKDRIQELKARASAALDNALGVVAENLGREEARHAADSIPKLDMAQAAQEASAHNLNLARVMDLITDPFEDE